MADSAGTALVTGASAGIGCELARLFARDRYDLVLVARRRARLEALVAELTAAWGIRCEVIEKDLSAAGAAQTVLDELASKRIEVDVLVNNAGFGAGGKFVRGDPEVQLQMLQLNVVTLTHLTRLLLPGMLSRRRGKIMNVASTAAFQPGPLMAVYFASKAYVLSLSEALAEELRGTGVSVTALCPGPTATEFQERAGLEKSRLFDANTMTAAAVAAAGYAGLMRGKRLVIPGLRNRALVTAVRFAPRSVVTRVVRKMNQSR
jgi:short-subunit dehydrogenase